MTDPKAHAARRRLFARPFGKGFLRSEWEWVVREKAGLAVSRMKQEMMGGGKSDVMKWWMFLATDVATHLMFGESFQTLEKGEVCFFSASCYLFLRVRIEWDTWN